MDILHRLTNDIHTDVITHNTALYTTCNNYYTLRGLNTGPYLHINNNNINIAIPGQPIKH